MKRLMVMISVLFMMFSTTVTAANEYNWIEGGQSVDLGDIASLNLDSEFVFLDGDNTRMMATDYGDPVSGLEIGTVFPMDDNQTWAVFFDYEESGYIEDDEKSKIDAKALLKSFKEGTEEANKERQPGERFHVVGWDIEPFYDEQTHNLTWSILLENENKETFLNYNTRILTREGNISVILVTDPENREADKKVLSEKILSQLKVNDGKRYEDFDKSTDKVAGYGLSALMLGGAGLAVAKKAGLLAVIIALLKKFGIVLIAAIGALWGFIRKKKKNSDAPEETMESDELDDSNDSTEQQNK
ncbi:DUF2167 domain-containing protein [Bacillus ndiopicus]|uniref:DUF2167 domain-containing protein n=1 Tax=Bacillus ndiopicus TaxID=1347368 RepID=UPI0005A7DB12|nr:DUF2167 domain-containing protein [Bacillus ndiopicus]